MPTTTDIGVASPKAHGQAMTSTARAFTKALKNLGSAPKIHHKTKVRTDMKTTTGTNTLETLSVSFCIGALLLLASFTILMI